MADFRAAVDPRTGERFLEVRSRGRALLLDPLTNKGAAFTMTERDALGLHGLLPAAVASMEEQLERCYENFRQQPDDLARYVFLAALQDSNETLFFRLLAEHVEEMLPVVYTPAVGLACQRFSHIDRRPRGLSIGYDRRDDVEGVLRNHRGTGPAIIVVTDGERILGLGDQGAGGMGIPIGKLCLYTLAAGVPPWQTLPILLDVGTDNEERLADPLYVGLRQRRIRGADYQEFVDAFVAAVRNVFPRTLLQWEDFLKGNAIAQLYRFRDRLPSFNDDIQGTGVVVLAGILAGSRLTGIALSDQRIVIAGAGAAAHGIASLFVAALSEQGLDRGEARRRVWMVDTGGLVVAGRADLPDFKGEYARDPAELAEWRCRDRTRVTLEETIANARPAILVGTTAAPGLFDEAIVGAMAGVNARPLIFPLSNPTSKCECPPADALRWSEGRAIVAAGSPFPAVEHGGRRHRIGQCNNAFGFPGIGFGASVAGAGCITDAMLLDAARALAELVTESDLKESAVYPEVGRLGDCAVAVARAVALRAVAEGVASRAGPEELERRLREEMWLPRYLSVRSAA